jgi:phosphatidylserine/phosphatidylglycerophosphate/cardiolipin synthase-like enzyme
MYEFQQTSIANELIFKKKAGLEVQVLLDRSSQEMGDYLLKGGVAVKYYPCGSSNICHVKLICVDGKVSLMGGMNWGNHSPVNHDADILIKGPAANDLNDIFAKDWTYSGGTSSYTTSTPLTTSGITSITNITTFHSGHTTNADIKTHALQMISTAKHHIYLELFVLTDVDVIDSLINAHHDGIDVRVLLDPKQSANQKAYTELKNNGMKVSFYPVKGDQKFHIKMGVADSKEVIIGSCNWSKKGFYGNHEIDSDVVDTQTAVFFETMFQKDWANTTGNW